MEPEEYSLDLSTIIIKETSKDQIVPVYFDPLAESSVVELNGQLDENIAGNEAPGVVGSSLNEEGFQDLHSEIFDLKKKCTELVGKLHLAKIEMDGLQEMLRIQRTYIKELEHKLTQGNAEKLGN